MRKLIIILFVLTTNLSFSQNEKFNKLIKLFENESNETIPNSLAILFFDFEPTEMVSSVITNEIVFRTEKYIGLAITGLCGAGGSCEFGEVRTFTLDGKFIDSHSYESNLSDCTDESSRSCIFKSDTLLIFEMIKKQIEDCLDSEENIIYNIVQLDYVKIVDGKYAKTPEVVKVNTQRKYYWTSSSILTEKYLHKFSKSELSIMRNEIFADHGYIFKSTKWQDFFSYQSWYKPEFIDVTDRLSFIEKQNIELIYKIENSKSE